MRILKRIAFSLVLVLAVTFGAHAALVDYVFTERYAETGGTGDGLTPGNPYDITDIAGDQLAGRRFNIAGDFAMAAVVSWTTSGTDTAPIAFKGWTAGFAAPAVALADNPVLDFDVATGIGITYGLNQIYENITVENASNNGWGSTIADNVKFIRVVARFNGLHGIVGDNAINIIDSQIYDNARGVDVDLYPKIISTEAWGHNNYNYQVDSNATFDNVYSRGATDGISFTGTGNGNTITNSTIDGATKGVDFAGGARAIIKNSLITNCTAGLFQTTSDSHLVDGSNFFGNTDDMDGGVLSHNSGNTFVDPDYVDIANNDYEITNSALIGLSSKGLTTPANDSVYTVGAWQSSGGGGGLTPPGPGRGFGRGFQ